MVKRIDERRTRAYIIAQLKVEELVEFERLWKQFISEIHRYGKPYEIALEFKYWKAEKERY